MAINIRTTYPDQTDPESTALPFGTPRDVTTPGDNTGTPWKADGLGGDLVGFIQSVLAAAGTPPNNTAESVSNPQILNALRTVLSPVGIIRAKVSPSGTVINSLPSIDGYEIQGDGFSNDVNGVLYGKFTITGAPLTDGPDCIVGVYPVSKFGTKYSVSPADLAIIGNSNPQIEIRAGGKIETGLNYIEVVPFRWDTTTATWKNANQGYFMIEVTYARF